MTGVHRSELTPVAFLQRAAYLHPARVAVAHEDGRRITYGELEERCHRLANALRARGLRHGDRVAVLSPNAPAILEAHYAVPLAGGVLVAINTRLAPAEVDLILRHSGARVLLVDHALAPLVEALDLAGVDVVRIDDTGAAGRSLRAAARRRLRPSGPSAGSSDEEEPISINYTSGTTGAPKGVVYTHRGAYLNALGRGDRDRPRAASSVYLWTLPMFHCNGWCFPWAVTAVGGAPRVPAHGRSRARLGADRRRGRDALQRRADGAHRRRRPPDARTGWSAPVTVLAAARAALADAARAAARSSTSASSTSTA